MTTAHPSAELGPDAAATLAKLNATLAQIRQLNEDAETFKAQLRGTLGAGAYTVGGRLALSITASRRFSAERAVELLPPDMLAAVVRPMVDPQLAKQTLPPALYSACSLEVGAPTVKLA